jgi:CRP-like cAMP-binding protein
MTWDQHDLVALPLFAGMSAADIAEVAQLATVIEVPAGGIIFSEAEPGDSLYAVLRGLVDIRCRDRSGQARTLATLEAGAILGEVALLMPQPRVTSAVAVSATVVLRLTNEAFMTLLKQPHSAAHHLLFNLAQGIACRLGEVSRHLMHLLADQSPMQSSPPEGELAELRRQLFTKWQF